MRFEILTTIVNNVSMCGNIIVWDEVRVIEWTRILGDLIPFVQESRFVSMERVVVVTSVFRKILRLLRTLHASILRSVLNWTTLTFYV